MTINQLEPNFMNILLIEDNLSLREEWAELLENRGHSVTGYRSAENVINNIYKNPCFLDKYEASIIDIKLKGKLTGIDLFREIRKHSSTGAIFLTATQNPSDVAALVKIDPKVHCLTKQLNSPEHPETVLTHLKNIEEKLQFAMISVFDCTFQIPNKQKKEGLRWDVIRCAAIGEKLLKLPLTTQQFQILKKILEDHKTGQGNAVTTKENLMIALGRPADEYTTTIEAQISKIRGTLPNHIMIKNARGGYYFDQEKH